MLITGEGKDLGLYDRDLSVACIQDIRLECICMQRGGRGRSSEAINIEVETPLGGHIFLLAQ